MADQELQGKERRRFPSLVATGLVLAVVVTVAAFAVDSRFAIPVLVLTVICAAAAVAFRMVAGRARMTGGDDADSTSNVPTQEARFERPLGDTPEAHDEISVHDLPPEHPGRHRTEEIAEGKEQTTPGPLP